MPDHHQSKNGDQPGVETLLIHLDAAYNFARWLMGDATEAEDMVQNAYLRAISNIGSHRGGDSRAWLLAILRNVCYDRLKQRGSPLNQTAHLDETAHLACRQIPDPETAMILAERGDLLKTSLAELPPEYREVLILRLSEQLSYARIAEIASIPLGTVMSRLNRARRRLHSSMTQDQAGPRYRTC